MSSRGAQRRFEFSGRYPLAAPRLAVLDALRRPEDWPRWWPQITNVHRYDDMRGAVTIRSELPLTLHLTLTREVDDAVSGVLRARLEGDLTGWVQFSVTGDAHQAVLVHTQDCLVTKRSVGSLLRWVPVVRPLLTLNHNAMMRSGMRGLQVYAASHPAQD